MEYETGLFLVCSEDAKCEWRLLEESMKDVLIITENEDEKYSRRC